MVPGGVGACLFVLVVVVVAWSRGSVSARRRRLPADWAARRRVVLDRDGGVCQWRLSDGSVCGREASDVDHVVANDDDSFGNLRALCSSHHRVKTSGEGWRARERKLREVRGRFRRVESHPAYKSGGGV